MLLACLASAATVWLLVILFTGVRAFGAPLFLGGERAGLDDAPLELSPTGRLVLLAALFGLVTAAALALESGPDAVEASSPPVAVEAPAPAR